MYKLLKLDLYDVAAEKKDLTFIAVVVLYFLIVNDRVRFVTSATHGSTPPGIVRNPTASNAMTYTSYAATAAKAGEILNSSQRRRKETF